LRGNIVIRLNVLGVLVGRTENWRNRTKGKLDLILSDLRETQGYLELRTTIRYGNGIEQLPFYNRVQSLGLVAQLGRFSQLIGFQNNNRYSILNIKVLDEMKQLHITHKLEVN